MSGILETLWVGLISGVLSSLLVLILFWLRQRIIDWFGIRAFKAIFCYLQNPVSKDSWEVRGRIYNNTSIQVYAYPILLDLERQNIDGCGVPFDAWIGEELKGGIPIPPKSWREFRIENMRRGNKAVPVYVNLMLSYFTLKKARERIYKIEPCELDLTHN